MATNQELVQYGQQWHKFFTDNPGAYQSAIAQGMPRTAATWEAYGQQVANYFNSRKDVHQSMLSWNQQAQPQPYQYPQQGQAGEEDLDDYMTRREALDFAQRLLQEQKTQHDVVLQAVRYKHEIDELRNEELYQHTGFKPTRDPKAIAEYAVEHGVSDIRKAYEGWSAPQQAKASYDRGRQEQLAEDRARGRVPTTTSKSYDRASQTEHSQLWPDSPKRRDQILDRISEKTGIARDDKPQPAQPAIRRTFDSAAVPVGGESSGGAQGSSHGSPGGQSAA